MRACPKLLSLSVLILYVLLLCTYFSGRIARLSWSGMLFGVLFERQRWPLQRHGHSEAPLQHKYKRIKTWGWWKSNNAWGCCWHRPTSFCGFYALSTCSVYEYIVVYELLQWPLLVTQTAHIEAADYFLLVALLLAVFLPLFLLLLLWSLLISASDHIDWNWWWWWCAGEMRTSRSRKEMKWKRENRKREKKTLVFILTEIEQVLTARPELPPRPDWIDIHLCATLGVLSSVRWWTVTGRWIYCFRKKMKVVSSSPGTLLYTNEHWSWFLEWKRRASGRTANPFLGQR